MKAISRRTFLKAFGASAAVATAHELRSGGSVLRALTDREKAAFQGPEEQWLPTVCGQCPAGCGMMVRVVDGRAVVVYSRYDFGCAFEGFPCAGCRGLELESAEKLIVNVLLYAMTE